MHRECVIWYKNTASTWTQALPMGNGHLGAMAYGGEEGLFDLTESTCWSGGVQEKYLSEDAAQSMKLARELLIDGKYTKAEELLKKCNGLKENFGTQLPLGRLWVTLENKAECGTRQLDLRTGVCSDKLDYGDKLVERNSFISNPDKVMCIKLDAGGEVIPGVSVWLEGYSQHCSITKQSNGLLVVGRALEMVHSDGLHGVSYDCMLRIVTDGQLEWTTKGILIKEAKRIEIYVTAATDMFYKDKREICKQRIEKAEKKGWDQLYKTHCDEHTVWMDCCTLELADGEKSKIPTDKRLKKYKEDEMDNGLEALFFQYGRYVILSSSRPDSLLPAALQGIWNDNKACKMEWTDDMHLDINTQMNYFPAQTTGLGECCIPLYNWVKNILSVQGCRIARELYSSDGWVAHTVSNAYGWAAPGWGASNWSYHVTGGAWIATHLWEHYLYTKNEGFLRESWSILRNAAKFIYDILLPHKATGELLVTPSISPENKFYFEGGIYSVAAGCTVDTSIARYIFGIVLKTAKILDISDDFLEKLSWAFEKLPKFKVGKHGQLMEWHEDFDEPMPDHRHTSHLLSVYPFGLIDIDDTPDLIEAVKISIKRRLGEDEKNIMHVNWAGALLILYTARLQEGEEAGKLLRTMIKLISRENMMIPHAGGIYELDGNTGLTAGIVEMLLHSHRDELNILPAIPEYWSKGKFNGLIGRGGHRVSVEWSECKPVKVEIKAGSDDDITLRFKSTRFKSTFKKGEGKKFIYKNMMFYEIK